MWGYWEIEFVDGRVEMLLEVVDKRKEELGGFMEIEDWGVFDRM